VRSRRPQRLRNSHLYNVALAPPAGSTGTLFISGTKNVALDGDVAPYGFSER
jgi:hypothetical protein